jgi:hypothetical protein
MLMMLLVNGFSPTELSASLGTLKAQTKNLGTHNQREQYWQAYQNIQSDIAKYASIDVDDGKLYGIVKYYSNSGSTDDEKSNNTSNAAATRTEYEPFTDRQRTLVKTPKVFMGRHIKLLVDDDENAGSGKEFFMPWFGDEAEAAYLDITAGEACISLDSDRGVFVSTRIKRKHCANLPASTLKTIDALKEYIANALQPDAPLQSVAWNGHHPPSVNSYNVILTGVWPTSITHHLPDDVAAHTNTTSVHEIYDLFEKRRNTHYIQEAELLIAKMLVEIHKNAAGSSTGAGDMTSSSVHTGSMKDLACAKRNALLKKVYIDASKTKFIENAKKEADSSGFEVIVVHGRTGEDAGTFEKYGSMVFETFYKLDLSIYG